MKSLDLAREWVSKFANYQILESGGTAFPNLKGAWLADAVSLFFTYEGGFFKKSYSTQLISRTNEIRLGKKSLEEVNTLISNRSRSILPNDLQGVLFDVALKEKYDRFFVVFRTIPREIGEWTRPYENEEILKFSRASNLVVDRINREVKLRDALSLQEKIDDLDLV